MKKLIANPKQPLSEGGELWHPDEPRFLMEFIKKNTRIAKDITAIELNQSTLASHIFDLYRQSKPGIIIQCFNELKPSKQRVVDFAFYGFLSLQLNYKEFYSFSCLCLLYDQFCSGRCVTYKSNKQNEQSFVSISLGNTGVLEEKSFINTEGELTDFFYKFNDDLIRCCKKERYPFNAGKFKTLISKIPRYLNGVYTVLNSDYKDSLPENLLVDWNWMPYGLSVENAIDNNTSFFPSYPIFEAILKACVSDENDIVLPRICLGSVSPYTLAKIHLMGYHPVSIIDDRVNTNLLWPHHRFGGNIYNVWHDQIHSQLATQIPGSYRTFACHYLVEIVSKMKETWSRKGYDLDAFIEPLVDLSRRKFPEMSDEDYYHDIPGLFLYTFDTTLGGSKPLTAEHNLILLDFYNYLGEVPQEYSVYSSEIQERMSSYLKEMKLL